MDKTREDVAALDVNTKFRVIDRDGIVLHTTGSTIDLRIYCDKTFKIWHLVEYIGDPVPIRVDGDDNNYWLNADIFAELWSKGKIELVKDCKVEDRDDLKPGMLMEIRDLNTGTWVYGMLLNVYDNELHAGVILSILCPNGSTVEIDACYADVYTAPDYKIEYFKRQLQRAKYELSEKQKLIDRGISLASSECPDEKQVKIVFGSNGFDEDPLIFYVDPSWTTEFFPDYAYYVGWIDAALNKHPAKLVLAKEKNHQTDKLCADDIDWVKFPIIREKDEKWVHFEDLHELIASTSEHLALAQENQDRRADAAESLAPRIKTVKIIKKKFPITVTALNSPATTAVTTDTDEVVSVEVDEKLWLDMGWVGTDFKPMYLAGTRWLKRGDAPDMWVFVALTMSSIPGGLDGGFKFPKIAIGSEMSSKDFELACRYSGCIPSNMLAGSAYEEIKMMIDHYKSEIEAAFRKQNLFIPNSGVVQFAPIKIIPKPLPYTNPDPR